MFICLEKNPDGSHAVQYGGYCEEGWAFVPHDIIFPDTFPFVNIEAEEVTHPANDVSREFTQLEVVAMTEGKEIPVEMLVLPKTNAELEAENKLLKEQCIALSDQMDFYEECLVEMAGLVYA